MRTLRIIEPCFVVCCRNDVRHKQHNQCMISYTLVYGARGWFPVFTGDQRVQFMNADFCRIHLHGAQIRWRVCLSVCPSITRWYWLNTM